MKCKNSISMLLALFAIVGALQAQTLNDSLVGYWPFNGNANDESGNGNNGVAHGATLTSDRFGNLNSAYSFDGIDDYIVMEDTTSLNPGNITISCWYKTVSFEGVGNNPIIEKAFYSHTTPHFQYHIGVTGDLYTYSTKQRFASDISIDLKDRRIHTDEYFWNIGEWYLLSVSYDSLNYKFYVNDVLIGDSIIDGSIDSFKQDLYVGKFGNLPSYTPGVIDDIRIYNRALSSNEIDSLFQESKCFEISVNDTITYYVSNSDYQSIGPRTFFIGPDTLQITTGFCDSIVNRYETYIYKENYCTDSLTFIDTLTVIDTIIVIDSISVTDTLIIDVTLTDVVPANKSNTIKIYPNPAKEFVIIHTDDFSQLVNYSIGIENSLGQTVFNSKIDQMEIQINVNDFGGDGTYFVKVYNSHGTIIEIRKLILL